jgi:hypothetical protein
LPRLHLSMPCAHSGFRLCVVMFIGAARRRRSLRKQQPHECTVGGRGRGGLTCFWCAAACCRSTGRRAIESWAVQLSGAAEQLQKEHEPPTSAEVAAAAAAAPRRLPWQHRRQTCGAPSGVSHASAAACETRGALKRQRCSCDGMRAAARISMELTARVRARSAIWRSKASNTQLGWMARSRRRVLNAATHIRAKAAQQRQAALA